MDIMALIDKMEDLVSEGKKVPLTSSVMVNELKIYDIIDEIRSSFPDEIKQARWIVKERQEMLDEAEKEADKLVDEANHRAETMAADTEIVKKAEEHAGSIMDKATAHEREIRLGAEDYADEMLANLEVNLGKLLSAVQRGRDRLQGKSNESVRS